MTVVTAVRLCSRPGCAQPAGATLAYGYAAQTVWLDRLTTEADPNRYDLCPAHARRLRVPAGWRLVDRRGAAGA